MGCCACLCDSLLCPCIGSSAPFKGMAGPRSRRCRDVLCLIIFVIFWAGMLAIGALAFIYGNVDRLSEGGRRPLGTSFCAR